MSRERLLNKCKLLCQRDNGKLLEEIRRSAPADLPADAPWTRVARYCDGTSADPPPTTEDLLVFLLFAASSLLRVPALSPDDLRRYLLDLYQRYPESVATLSPTPAATQAPQGVTADFPSLNIGLGQAAPADPIRDLQGGDFSPPVTVRHPASAARPEDVVSLPSAVPAHSPPPPPEPGQGDKSITQVGGVRCYLEPCREEPRQGDQSTPSAEIAASLSCESAAPPTSSTPPSPAVGHAPSEFLSEVAPRGEECPLPPNPSFRPPDLASRERPAAHALSETEESAQGADEEAARAPLPPPHTWSSLVEQLRTHQAESSAHATAFEVAELIDGWDSWLRDRLLRADNSLDELAQKLVMWGATLDFYLYTPLEAQHDSQVTSTSNRPHLFERLQASLQALELAEAGYAAALDEKQQAIIEARKKWKTFFERHGVERITALRGEPFVAGVIEVSTRPPVATSHPQMDGQVAYIEPGEGGYRRSGRVILPARAVPYRLQDP